MSSCNWRILSASSAGADFFVNLVGRPAPEQARLPEPHQRPAELRLEHDDDGQRRNLKELIEQEFDARQIELGPEDLDHDEQADQDEGDALEQSRAARAAKESDDPVDDQPDQEHLDGDAPPSQFG